MSYHRADEGIAILILLAFMLVEQKRVHLEECLLLNQKRFSPAIDEKQLRETMKTITKMRK